MPCTDLTPTLQAKCAKSWERYDRIYSEVKAEAQADLVAHGFDPECVAWHDIHREAQRRVELDQRHEAEDRPEYVASGLY